MKRRLDGMDAPASGSGAGAPAPPPPPGALTSSFPTSGINFLNGKPLSARYSSILEGRKKLPVWGFLAQLQDLMRANQVIVVEGETGSGKTTQVRACAFHFRRRRCIYSGVRARAGWRCRAPTAVPRLCPACPVRGSSSPHPAAALQIPQFLVAGGFCMGADGVSRMVACTQPRRVAAMSVAARVADEMDVPLGE
jgi:hypothetical protein